VHQGCYVSGVQHQLFLLLWTVVQCKGMANELSHGLDAWLLVQRDETYLLRLVRFVYQTFDSIQKEFCFVVVLRAFHCFRLQVLLLSVLVVSRDIFEMKHGRASSRILAENLYILHILQTPLPLAPSLPLGGQRESC
jgi:hypothetical protein